ncbi:MAG TPA: hypothetical protein DCG60_00890 [Tissierella sp.]|nr:hypothetical protein [Tissierella sp.]
MIEINFSGKKLFEFKDSGFIQILGLDEELKRLIIDIYIKIFSGYKFSDVDIEAMNGYYPEVKKDEKVLKKDDNIVIKLSSIDDFIEQLQVKNDSTFFKYLLSLNKELSINTALSKVEESLMGLSIELDKFIDDKMSLEDFSIMTNVYGVDLKKIIKSFIDIDFIDQHNHRKALWLLNDKDIINLFLSTIRLLIEENNNVTVIIDGLDTKIGLKTYTYFKNKLYCLAEEYPNFKIWLIPKTESGIWLNYEIFDSTYILSDEIIPMGDFDITYESICRSYPDNNLPTRFQVLEALLKLFSFHHSEKTYWPSKETIILQVFLNLLDKGSIRLENPELSNLETKFLTSFIR